MILAVLQFVHVHQTKAIDEPLKVIPTMATLYWKKSSEKQHHQKQNLVINYAT